MAFKIIKFIISIHNRIPTKFFKINNKFLKVLTKPNKIEKCKYTVLFLNKLNYKIQIILY
jgi:hypothetical protein